MHRMRADTDNQGEADGAASATKVEIITLRVPEAMAREIEVAMKGKFATRSEYIRDLVRQDLRSLAEAATPAA